MLTYSRGGWLVVPLIAAAYLIFIPRVKRVEAFWVMAVIFTVAALSTPLLARAYLAEQGFRAWLLVFAGTAVILLLQYFMFEVYRKIRPAIVISVIGAIALALLLIPAFYVFSTFSQPLELSDEGRKTIEDRPAVKPGTEYTLSAELTGNWSVLIGGQKDDGFRVLLLEDSGEAKVSESKEFIFDVPEDVRSIYVTFENNEGSLVLGDVTLTGAGKSKQLNFTWNRLVPDLLYRRFFGFKIQERNVQERLVFFKDAVEIIKDYPLLGLGGHGWKSRYFQYQSERYSTTEVHNHFLQVWIETGLAGFLLFLGIWLSFLYSTYRVLRVSEDSEKKVLAVAVAAAVMAVVTHSLYDFTLSLGAIGLFVWSLMGVTRSMLPVTEKEQWKPYINILAVGIAACLFIFVVNLSLGHSAYKKGSALLRSDLGRAVKTLESAVKYDRFDPEIRVTLAEVYEDIGVQAGSSSYHYKAEEQLSRAIALDRYNPRYHNLKGVFFVRTGNFAVGVEYLDNASRMQPFYNTHYIISVQAALHIAKLYFSEGDTETARQYLTKALPVEERMAEYFSDTGALAISLGEVHYLLGNYEKAIDYLEVAYENKKDRAVAAVILALIYDSRDDIELSGKYYQQALEWDTASADLYESLKVYQKQK
jgi:Tfp pilus assembly protein PilF